MRVAVSLAVRGGPHHPAMTTRLPHSYGLLLRLNRDWNDLSRRGDALATARQWPLAAELGHELHSLDDVLRATGWFASADERRATCCDASRHEPMLTQLLVTARTDDLAARVVLQRLLAGLVSIAKRWERRHDGDPLIELVAAAWLVVRTYPVERRPHHLVANLLGDCEYHAFRRATRRALVQVPVDGIHLDRACEPAAVEALQELVELAAAAPDLTDLDRQLLGLLLSGHSTEDVAAALDISERTVRNHKHGLVHRLRNGALAA